MIRIWICSGNSLGPRVFMDEANPGVGLIGSWSVDGRAAGVTRLDALKTLQQLDVAGSLERSRLYIVLQAELAANGL
jgi:hypothetical protein